MVPGLAVPVLRDLQRQPQRVALGVTPQRHPAGDVKRHLVRPMQRQGHRQRRVCAALDLDPMAPVPVVILVLVPVRPRRGADGRIRRRCQKAQDKQR